MQKATVLFLAGVLCVASLSAAAQNYTGDYAWLRFWDGATASASGVGYKGTWGGADWTSSNNVPGVCWLMDHKEPDDPKVEQWYAITWTEAMTLTGARVEGRNDQHGRRNNIHEYKLQYWNDVLEDWVDIAVADWNDTTGSPLTLTGTTDYYVRFLDEVTTTAIRVYFPENSYDHERQPGWPSEGTWNGPGLTKFLPIGNLASGEGLDSTNSSFNIFGTNPADNFLGINPAIYTIDRNGNMSAAAVPGLMDNNVSWDSPRFGWSPSFTGEEAFVCDLGVTLDIHGVTLYGGTGMTFISGATMEVYVTDDLKNWGESVGTIAPDATGALSLSDITDAVGRYVIVGSPALDYANHIFVTEIAINASAIPEPATMTLLALGGLAMLRRRR
ncbi:MAG: discoidin domain-containing protein [Phycisphaerae bacterium]|nr:discoidin domain-containing protein [Phycisphaerae bacterium]